MSKFIEINGVVTIINNVTVDQFTNEFIDWLESKGYEFGGGTKEVEENAE
jgi:hypothetical protein